MNTRLFHRSILESRPEDIRIGRRLVRRKDRHKGTVSRQRETGEFVWTDTDETGRCCYYRRTRGGGYGNPLERDIDMVVNDVKQGYVSLKVPKKTTAWLLIKRHAK